MLLGAATVVGLEGALAHGVLRSVGLSGRIAATAKVVWLTPGGVVRPQSRPLSEAHRALVHNLARRLRTRAHREHAKTAMAGTVASTIRVGRIEGQTETARANLASDTRTRIRSNRHAEVVTTRHENRPGRDVASTSGMLLASALRLAPTLRTQPVDKPVDRLPSLGSLEQHQPRRHGGEHHR